MSLLQPVQASPLFLPLYFLHSLPFHKDTLQRAATVLQHSAFSNLLTFLTLLCRIPHIKASPCDRRFCRLTTILPLLDMPSTLLNSVKYHLHGEAEGLWGCQFSSPSSVICLAMFTRGNALSLHIDHCQPYRVLWDVSSRHTEKSMRFAGYHLETCMPAGENEWQVIW